MLPSGGYNNAVFIKHVRLANYLKRLEKDTGVKILAYSSKSRSFSALPLSFFLIFQPLAGGCALIFAKIMLCMFGYLKLSMIV